MITHLLKLFNMNKHNKTYLQKMIYYALFIQSPATALNYNLSWCLKNLNDSPNTITIIRCIQTHIHIHTNTYVYDLHIYVYTIYIKYTYLTIYSVKILDRLSSETFFSSQVICLPLSSSHKAIMSQYSLWTGSCVFSTF